MLQMEYNRDLDLTQAGKAEGKAEGIAEGIAIGQARAEANMLAAMKRLAAKGLSIDEVIKLISQQTQQPGFTAPA